ASRCASTRPMAPRPAIPTRVTDIAPPRLHGSKCERAVAATRACVRSYAACKNAASRALTLRAACPKASPDRSRISKEFPMRKVVFGALLAALASIAGPAGAQDFPTRPLTMIIPFAAGGPTDVLGRIVAARMGEVLGQNV